MLFMKRFGTLFLAAVLGSLCTIGVFEVYKKDSVSLAYTTQSPVSQVTYTTDENGREIPLDFTAIAAQVTPAVVHIKSTQEGRAQESQGGDPFRDFFGPRYQPGPSQST